MQLLFSGAKNQLAQQRDTTLSLGGFMSSTSIPNGRINALFSSISAYSQRREVSETIGIFLRNNTTFNITNLSITQIYSNILGVEDNQADFEWAAVIPTSSNAIELIGSNREIPFNATFFDPTTKRESCILRFTTASLDGEMFNILGESIIMDGDGIENMIDVTISHFRGVDTFRVEKYSNNNIFIERVALTETNDPVTLTTTGSGASNTVNFGGFINGVTSLVNTILPNESIGLWIKRTIKPAQEISCDVLEEEKLNNKEKIEIIFDFN